MKIKFVQSGGFAGLVKGVEVDTSVLPPNEASQLSDLVDASDLKTPQTKMSNSARDLFQYDLTIVDEGKEITATFDDATLPPEVKPLVGFLKQRSHPMPPD